MLNTAFKGTRKEAVAAAESKYFTGQPCKHGHVTFRYTANGACEECIHPKLPKRSASIARNQFWMTAPFAVDIAHTLSPELVKYCTIQALKAVHGWASEFRDKRRMTDKAAGMSYEAYVKNGWTDAQLIEKGILEIIK